MPLISDEQAGLEELEGAIPGKGKERKDRVLTPGSLFAERYEVQALLGKGALGSIYRVFDRAEKRVVALKILQLDLFNSEVLRQRFERFVKQVEGLHHPNLVKVYGHGDWEGQPYLVRDYVDGQSLDQLIIERKKTSRFFRLEEVLNIFSELAQALASVESRTFHGGLTPANILVTDERVLVTDLALARIFQPAQYSSLQIYYGNGYYYLAPEYDRAGSKIDQRSDLYASAVMAYEMLIGDIPRSPVIPPSVANPEIPPGLDGPFLKALDLNPENRHENLAVFIQQLRTLSGLLEFGQQQVSSIKLEPVVEKEQLDVNSSPAKSRIALAIEKQLQAHGAPQVFAAKEKMPVLPAMQSKHSVPSEPVLMSARPARIQQPRERARLWPWFTVAFGIFFALVMWASFFSDGKHKMATEDEAIGPEENLSMHDDRQAHREIIPKLSKKNADPEPREAAADKPVPPAKRAEPPQKKKSSMVPKKSSLMASAALVKKSAQCPKDMAYIPSGNFSYGNPSSDRDFLELSSTRVGISAFCIDPFEWPNHPAAKPLVNVSYAEAASACAKVGKRLCTEREWERACKGNLQRMYPYADSFQADACNTKDHRGNSRALTGAGNFSRCKNDWGVYDMSGNAAEWTSGILDKNKSDRMARGGSSKSSAWGAYCTHRRNWLSNIRRDDLGFRCCKSTADASAEGSL